MAGYNLFEKSVYASSGAGPCVFISHSKKDKTLAKTIADVLIAASVNVYFDENDKLLQSHLLLGVDAAVVRCIDEGLDKSSHLLGIITNNSKNSWWVPYEIGRTRAFKKPCAHFIAADVADLPSFIKIEKIIIDRIRLRGWIAQISGQSYQLVETREKSLSYAGLSSHVREYRSDDDIKFLEV